MSLFIAKMIADGSFKAYKLKKDGSLQYDMALDDRYSYFWKYHEDDGASAPDKKKYAE